MSFTDSENLPSCLVCLDVLGSDGQVCVAKLDPCGHDALCGPCAVQLVKNTPLGSDLACPLCRGVVARIGFSAPMVIDLQPANKNAPAPNHPVASEMPRLGRAMFADIVAMARAHVAVTNFQTNRWLGQDFLATFNSDVRPGEDAEVLLSFDLDTGSPRGVRTTAEQIQERRRALADDVLGRVAGPLYDDVD